MKLHGIFPPLATPFDHNGDIWKVKIQHNVSKLNLTPVGGYVVGGSTGEVVMLTNDEMARAWEWVAEASAPEKILIAGTAAEGVRETLERTKRAAGIGYKVALVRTPAYYKSVVMKPETQMLFFRAVADQSPVPVLIYNFPQVTGIDLSVETIAALAEHPNIIGIKESSGNQEKVQRLALEIKDGFQVLVGQAQTLASALNAGACGGILGFANAAPYAAISIWEAHRTREYAAALDWQKRISRPARLVTAKYSIPGLKHAMDLMGYYGGPPRLPLAPIGPDAKREIEEAFQDIRG